MFWGSHKCKKNNVGHVFSFKIVFMWVLSRHCLLGKLATIKKFSHIFQLFGPFLGIYTPCLWLYLKKLIAKHYQIIKNQCTIVTLTHWD